MTLTTDLVVHPFSTVGDNAEQSKRLCKVLCRFRLSRSSRSGRRSPAVHGQGLGEREVDAVRQWGDDKTPVQTHVFVSIAKVSSALTDDELIRFLLPVEAQLTLPLKLPRIENTAQEKSNTFIYIR